MRLLCRDSRRIQITLDKDALCCILKAAGRRNGDAAVSYSAYSGFNSHTRIIIKMKLPVNYEKLTPQQRREVREAYIVKQNGKCWHCGNLLGYSATKEIRDMEIHKELFPPSFFKWPVHLHHDHNTCMTIGAVHCLCNAVLWQYYGE